MSKPVFHLGAQQRCSNLTEAAILSRVVDNFIKGSSDSISIEELAEESMASTLEVARMLEGFVDADLLKLPEGAETGSLSKFRVKGAILMIEPVQNAIPGFAQIPVNDQIRSREDMGEEIIEADGTRYKATVRFNNDESDPWWILRVHRLDDDNQELELIAEEQFQEDDQAWDWWDKYRPGLDHPVLRWLESQFETKLSEVNEGVDPDDRDELVEDFAVDEETFQLLLAAKGIVEEGEPVVRIEHNESTIIVGADENPARYPGLDVTPQDPAITKRFGSLEVPEGDADATEVAEEAAEPKSKEDLTD